MRGDAFLFLPVSNIQINAGHKGTSFKARYLVRRV